jgi:hypothetical protein
MDRWSNLYRIDGSKVFRLTNYSQGDTSAFKFEYRNFFNIVDDSAANVDDQANHFCDGIIRFGKSKVAITKVTMDQRGEQDAFVLLMADFSMNLGDSATYIIRNNGKKYGQLKLEGIYPFRNDTLYHFKVSNYASLNFGYFISRQKGIQAIYDKSVVNDQVIQHTIGDPCILALTSMP